jgi:hypothetical protein
MYIRIMKKVGIGGIFTGGVRGGTVVSLVYAH